MSLGGPTPPDPYQTAAAQAGANRDSIAAAAQFNRVNQVTPFGNLSYSGTPGESDYTATTSVSPEIQAYINSQVNNARVTNNATYDRLSQLDNTPFSLSGLPGVQGANLSGTFDQGGPITNQIADAGNIQRGVSDAGPVMRTFGASGPIQANVGGADAATRNSVENALYQRATSRLDPQFQQAEAATRSRLANQGITQGSEAYNNELANFGQTKNDAYSNAMNDAIAAGGAEQSRLFGLGLQQGQFANQAQAQDFGQQLTRGNFYNSGQGQQFGQGLDIGNFVNAAQAQQYGQNANNAAFQNQAAGQQFAQNMTAQEFANQVAQQQRANSIDDRNRALQEYLTGRTQPIAEINALNGTAPGIQNPNFVNTPQYAPMGVPIGDYIMNNYNQQAANSRNLISSIFGLAGNAGSAAITKFCWVAREAMPERWLEMRKWMLTKAPKDLWNLYRENGERIAQYISDKPLLKARMRASMEAVLA